jgi:putative ABC transport system permease protein
MFGILRIAYKLLANDRTKFTALIVGITFAVFLMVQMTAMFAGVLSRSSATVYNVGASIWVMDPAVQTVSNSIPMPDAVLDEVRSLPGVKFAVPLYSGGGLVKLADGTYQAVTIMGLDDTTLFGRPQMLKGQIEDIYGESGFIAVVDSEYTKLGSPKVGDEFEINDNRARIVGLARVASNGLFGVPSLYTTYSRALQYLPNTRFTTSYILVEPKSEADIPAIRDGVARIGYIALTRDEFVSQISHFYTFKTGIGTNLLMMSAIAFIVGLSISGQTFYSFILENLEKFGALKAIGMTSRELITMILFQAGFVSLTGYGLGTGLCATMIWLARARLPDYASIITPGNLLLALGMVVVIAGVSSWFGVRRVLRIEPFDIFRG